MTIQQALEILEQVTAQCKLTRQEHALVMKALETIKNLSDK